MEKWEEGSYNSCNVGHYNAHASKVIAHNASLYTHMRAHAHKQAHTPPDTSW